MKKIFAIILVMVLLFSFTACSAPAPAQFTVNWGKQNVNETSVYSVNVVKAESAMDDDAPVLSGSGEYTTVLTGSAKDNYTYETTFSFVGKYTMADGTTVDVNDKLVTKVEFKDIVYSLKPVSSYKNYEGKTVNYKNGQYSVDDMAYESTVTYGEKDADIKTAKKGTSGSFDTAIGGLGTEFNVALGKSTVYDNEQLTMVLRALMKKEGLSQTINIVSGLSNEIIPMSVSIGADTIEEIDTNINGVNAKMEVYPTLVRKNANDGGNGISMYFAVNDMGEVTKETDGTWERDRTRLVRYEQSIPYTYDMLQYNLVEYNYAK